VKAGKYRHGVGVVTAAAAFAAAAAVAVVRGSALEALAVGVAGLAVAAALSEVGTRRPWIVPTLFWAALSLPVVKHLAPGTGAPAVNVDHVVAYPVDVVLSVALAAALYERLRAEGRGGPGAARRTLAAFLKPDLVAAAIIALALATVLSLYHAPRPAITLSALVDIGRLYLVYVLFRQLAAPGPRGVAAGLLAVGAAQSALCLLEFGAQHNFGLWEKPGWGGFIFGGATPEAARLLIARGGGTFEPNVTAQYLQIVLPFAAAAYLAAVGRAKRLASFALLAAAAGALFVTFSRGGWLGAACALVVLIGGAWFKKRALGLEAGPLTALTAAGVVIFVPAVAVILARGVGGDQLSAASRLADCKIALAMIRDHPLLGVGKGNFQVLAPLYNPWALAYPVHNVYLLFWAETGLGGLLALAAIMFGAFRAAARALARGTAGDVLFGLAALAAFAGLAVRMFISMSFVHPFVSLTFVALAAATAGLSRRPGPNSGNE
jgi:putative inorganic carbon (HCO3(-)) transporter